VKKKEEIELLIITPPLLNQEVGRLIGDVFDEHCGELGATIITKNQITKQHLRQAAAGKLLIVEITAAKGGKKAAAKIVAAKK